MKRTKRLFAVLLVAVMAISFAVTAVGCNKDDEKTTYTVTLPTGLTGGTITADKTSVKAGEKVVVTATPEANYELDWIKFNNESQTKTNDNKYEINNVQKNVTVTAAFKQTEVVEDSMFLTFPEDRFINSAEALTYYLNAEGTETYRSDLPTVKDGAQLNTIVTMKEGSVDAQMEFLATDENYSIAGGVKEVYSENGFNSGILDNISSGIYMKPNYAYEIKYTASKDGKTESRIQTVMVAKSYDLASETFGSVIDENAEVINMQVVDAPSAMFGDDKVLKLYNADGSQEQSGFFKKEGLYFGKENYADFQWVIYNDSDAEVIVACKAGSNVMDPKVAPHSYMLWNPYSRPYYQDAAEGAPHYRAIFNAHGYLNKDTGALNQVQFTVYPTGPAAAEATVYIGGLRGTATEYTEFATFPEDRIISSSEMGDDPYGITYYVNESGTEEFRSDFPTAVNDTTEITAKVTARRFRAFEKQQFGNSSTGIDEAQFENGVLSDISDGINMLPGYAYYIEYTATMADDSTEKRTQTIILYDMAPRIADVFTGATITSAYQVEKATIERAKSAILGNKMVNIEFADHSDSEAQKFMRQVRVTKTGIALTEDKTTQRLEFLIYNPNDFAISMFNVVGTDSRWPYDVIEPHTYILWDPYSIPGYAQYLWSDGLITDTNELGTIAFYFKAENGAAGNLYVGEFMATLPTPAA